MTGLPIGMPTSCGLGWRPFGSRNGSSTTSHNVVEAGGGPVLDIGCGPGWLTRDLASRGLAVSGIDISTAMLRLARTNNPGLGFAAASLTQIPVADRATAGVFCWHVLHHVPDEDLEAAIREVARVIVPGGSLMLGGHVGDSTYVKTEGYGGLPMRVLFAPQPRNLRASSARCRAGGRRHHHARPGPSGFRSHLARAPTSLTSHRGRQ